MPSPSIKTIKDLIFYQYAKLIAASVGIPKTGPKRKEYYSFVMDRTKTRSVEISMSTITRELKMQIASEINSCVYCGMREELSWDHLIPSKVKGVLILQIT